jgi:hypothetical protein
MVFCSSYILKNKVPLLNLIADTKILITPEGFTSVLKFCKYLRETDSVKQRIMKCESQNKRQIHIANRMY